jgi:hypothetical protein
MVELFQERARAVSAEVHRVSDRREAIDFAVEIERVLTIGVHGPERLVVVVVGAAGARGATPS